MPSEKRRAWPVIHIVLRSLLGAALVVMLVVIVLRVVGPGSPGTAVADPSAPATATDTPTQTPTPTSTPIPTPTTTTPSGGGSSGGGTGGTGGGTGGGGTGTTAPVITSFNGPSTIACPVPAEAPVPGVPAAETPYVSFSWTGTGAETAYFGIGTADAELAPYSEVGVNDSISVDYQCSNSSVTFAITMVGPGGKTSKTINVVNTGYVG